MNGHKSIFENNGLFEYTSMTTYQGKENMFSILKVETDKLNKETANYLKAEFVLYFENKLYKRSNVTKHALDLSKVKVMDAYGLAAILIFNRLSVNNIDGVVSLINCNNDVSRLLEIAQVDTILDVKDKVSDL